MNKKTNKLKRLLLLLVIWATSWSLFAGDTFTLVVDNAAATSGGTVCVQVTTKNFTNIIGLQYDLSYDQSLLDFTEFTDLNAELSLLQYNEVNPGIIRVSWTSGLLQGVTLADGSLVYNMCFSVTGGNGTIAPLNFVTANTIEVIADNTPIDVIPWALVDGSVNIGGSAASSLSIDDACSIATTCTGNDGAIDITVTTDQPPLTYSWTGPSGFASTDEDLSGLEVGLYSLTVTDNAGTQLTANVLLMVGGTMQIEADVTNATCGQTDGAISITSVTGGTAPYTYLWSNGETTATITNLAVEPYEITVTDAMGCTSSTFFFVGEDGFDADVSAVVVHPDCNNNMGSIDLTVNGSSGPYTYSWSNGATTEDLMNLPEGAYVVTITDAVGCTDTENYLLIEPSNVLSEFYDCDPTTDLAELFVINWVGGDQLYIFEWSNGEITSDSLVSSIDDLANGSYSVTVTGQTSGCSYTLGPIDINCVAQSSNNCFTQHAISTFGNAGDQVCMDILATGFTDILGMQYTLAWDTAVLEYSHIQNYNLPELDDIDFGENFTEFGMLTVLWNQFGDPPVTVPDGTVIYQLCFDLIGATGSSSSVNFVDGPTDFEVIADGLIEVGFNGVAGEINIGNIPPSLAITAVCSTAPACVSAVTGEIDITVIGGVAPLTYEWTDETGTVVSTQEDFNTVNADGWYQVNVTDANGAVATAFANVMNNNPQIYSNFVTHITCNGEATGSIQLEVNAGTEPYSYIWSNGESTQNIFNLSAGAYSVTVQDQEGCTTTQDYVVNEPSPITVTLVEHTCPSALGGDGELEVLASGGLNMFTYLWPDGTDAAHVVGLEEGDYEVTVTDVMGCSEAVSFYLGDCVWPGDTDSNGVVNNFDLLNIGLAYGSSGPVRSNANITWTAQNAENWPQSTPNSNVNYKHIDTNGEGLVDDNDTLAIAQNWGQTHNFIGGSVEYQLPDLPPASSSVIAPFYIQPDTFEANETVSLPVILGDANDPIEELYGLAFSITFDPEIVVPGSAYLTFDPSWIGTLHTDMITIQKTFHGLGRLDVAMVRTDGVNIAGMGQIASFFITIEDDLVAPPPGFTVTDENIHTDFGIENVRIITNIEEEVLVGPLTTTSTIQDVSTSIGEVSNNFELQLYPNPVTDQLQIKSSAGIKTVRIYDVAAKLMDGYAFEQEREVVLKTKHLEEGAYVVKIQTVEGVAVERIVVLK